jgi:CRISPR/Cas system-associated exonuclease Cas4 (RecB family)
MSKTLPSIFDEVLSMPNTYVAKDAKVFKIKPSSLGSPCLRKIYYTAAGVEEDYPFPLDGKRRMVLGDAIHDILHDIFSKAGILIDYVQEDGTTAKDFNGNPDYEFPLVCPELFIKKAKIDAVMNIEQKLWIGEYKSINLKGFVEIMYPKPDHIIQAVTYFHVFNKLLSEGAFKHIPKLDNFTKAEGIRFLYICKDDTKLKEFVLTATDPIFTQIVDKIYTIKDHYDRKELPAKTQDWCQSCNFRDKCKKNFNTI